jgi:hypothetical protein
MCFEATCPIERCPRYRRYGSGYLELKTDRGKELGFRRVHNPQRALVDVTHPPAASDPEPLPPLLRHTSRTSRTVPLDSKRMSRTRNSLIGQTSINRKL